MKLQIQHYQQSNIPGILCDLTAIAQPFSAETRLPHLQQCNNLIKINQTALF